MATAQTIINKALRNLGAIGIGETPDADESAECLEILNDLVDAWRLESMTASYVVTAELAISAGTNSFDIGPTGDIAVPKPIAIKSAKWREDGINTFIDHTADQNDYTNWKGEDDTGTPSVLYFESTSPDATVHIFPTPVADGTIVLGILGVLESFADLTTDVDLPPGYESALAYNLPRFLAPAYEREVPQTTAIMANDTYAALKRANSRIPLLGFQTGLPMMSVKSNILEGR